MPKAATKYKSYQEFEGANTEKEYQDQEAPDRKAAVNNKRLSIY